MDFRVDIKVNGIVVGHALVTNVSDWREAEIKFQHTVSFAYQHVSDKSQNVYALSGDVSGEEQKTAKYLNQLHGRIAAAGIPPLSNK